MGLLYDKIHNYAWALELASHLIDDEKGAAEKTDHQINTRIFNNAFCGLLRNGIDFSIEESQDGGGFIIISSDDREYRCPVNTARNILRDSYEEIIAKKNENKEKSDDAQLQADSSDNTTQLSVEKESDVDDKKTDTGKDDFNTEKKSIHVPEINIQKVENAAVSDNPKTKTDQKKIVTPNWDDVVFYKPKEKDMIDLDSEIIKDQNDIHSEDTESEPDNTKDNSDGDEKINEEPDDNDVYDDDADADDEGDYISEDEILNEEAQDDETFPVFSPIIKKEKNENSGSNIIKPETDEENNDRGSLFEDDNLFKPKKEDHNNSTSYESEENKPVKAETENTEVKKKNKFLSSIFGDKKTSSNNEIKKINDDTKQETDIIPDESANEFKPRGPIVNKDPEPVITKNDWEGKLAPEFDAPAPPENDYSNDGGVLFHHVHTVTLKKRYGSEAAGPYRFVFWPTWIIDKFNGKRFGDFIVHVTDPNGNEITSCTEGDMKELDIKIDGKQFKVFATWDMGVFSSNVALAGKTESIFTINDEVHKEEPDQFTNKYLDQFRLERKGQPKHFIVPFKNNNRGEKNIPIIGYVEVNRKRYPLERRDGNMLCYKYSGNERMITGHWENGKFVFSVKDSNRFSVM